MPATIKSVSDLREQVRASADEGRLAEEWFMLHHLEARLAAQRLADRHYTEPDSQARRMVDRQIRLHQGLSLAYGLEFLAAFERETGLSGPIVDASMSSAPVAAAMENLSMVRGAAA